MKFFLSFLRQSFAVVALLVSASSTSAGIISTITVNQTLDLNATQSTPGPGFQGWQDVPAFNGGFNVPIAVGDTFEFTIDFLGDQALTANDLSFVWAFSYAEAGSPALDVRGTGTFSFLDASGSEFLTSNLKTSLEGEAHFGQQFNSKDFAGGLPSSLTFWGVRYVGTLVEYVDLPDGGVQTRNYDNPAFFLDASSISVVPEPSSLMLCGSFVLFGLTCNRRRGVL
jgi:hypothetical protein